MPNLGGPMGMYHGTPSRNISIFDRMRSNVGGRIYYRSAFSIPDLARLMGVNHGTPSNTRTPRSSQQTFTKASGNVGLGPRSFQHYTGHSRKCDIARYATIDSIFGTSNIPTTHIPTLLRVGRQSYSGGAIHSLSISTVTYEGLAQGMA